MTKILLQDILDILDPDNNQYHPILRKYLNKSTDPRFTEVRFLNFIVRCYLSVKDKWARMLLFRLYFGIRGMQLLWAASRKG